MKSLLYLTHFHTFCSIGFRYWIDLWKDFFTKLLNMSPGSDHIKLLQNLRESFQDYMCSQPQLIKKLKELLVKQRASLCSA